ncbi:MSMEG_1061 family FMN-dependent PPOX-type flavoprotein [Consotaella aegiceratis]|uniref:MSMEG_1061 family FMN-dependent PPOX-type flavoprotein n=1 Tax=Consotaella aegiceratis TaxID=3097961 RepID=UPI002F42C96C
MDSLDGSDLDILYDAPSECIQNGVLPHLTSFHREYLAAATFFCLATGRPEGLDASPRGGEAGFVKALDDRHVTFADWTGNNRIESMRNLVEDDRIAMLFLFPGLSIFMRINGRAHVSTAPELLATLQEGGKTPKTAIVMAIDQVLFHCGRAINRAGLWSEEAKLDRHALPSVGQMKAAMSGGNAAEAEAIDASYDRTMRTDLY